MEFKSISTVISTIKSIIEDKENELYYNEDIGELGVILPRQKGTGEYNVIMYHTGLNMISVRWYDTDIKGEVKLYLIKVPNEDVTYEMIVDLDESIGWDYQIQFVPVLTEEEYFQQSTIQDFSKVSLHDMISAVEFREYVYELLCEHENY